MVIDGVKFCDVCRLAIFDDLSASTIRIQHEGRMHRFHFHNSLEQPCLKAKIAELRRMFTEE